MPLAFLEPVPKTTFLAPSATSVACDGEKSARGKVRSRQTRGPRAARELLGLVQAEQLLRGLGLAGHLDRRRGLAGAEAAHEVAEVSATSQTFSHVALQPRRPTIRVPLSTTSNRPID